VLNILINVIMPGVDICIVAYSLSSISLKMSASVDFNWFTMYKY